MRSFVAILGAIAVLCGGAIAQERPGDDTELARLEAQAPALVERGARSEVVYAFQRAHETCGVAAVCARIEGNIQRYSLEGRPAPRLESGIHLGARLPSSTDLKGKVVLLFFWAHWCADCKAESAMVDALFEQYRARGVVLIAPTQRYGYAAEGRPASPDKELRYIMHVRDTSYGFMRQTAVPVGEANWQRYGIASTPTHVLIDRAGIIRLYHPGRIAVDILDAAIRRLL